MHLVSGELAWDITLRRDIDQVSMREVELHPKADEVDDYVEYKRLREARQAAYDEEPVKSMPTTPPTQTPEKLGSYRMPPGVSAERHPKDSPNILRHTPNQFDRNTAFPLTPVRAGLSTNVSPLTMPDRVMDGTSDSEPGLQQHRTRNVVEECSPRSSVNKILLNTTSQYIPSSERKDSVWSAGSKPDDSPMGKTSELRKLSVSEQSSKVEHLATTLGDLKTVTIHKGQMSRRFSVDLQHFANMVQQIRLETRKMARALPAAGDATDVDNEIELEYLQHCLGCLEDDLKVVRDIVTAVPSSKTWHQGDNILAGELPDEGQLEAKSSEAKEKELEVDSDDDVMTEALRTFEIRYSIDDVLASADRQVLDE